jgi:hypothetical protein
MFPTTDPVRHAYDKLAEAEREIDRLRRNSIPVAAVRRHIHRDHPIEQPVATCMLCDEEIRRMERDRDA